MTVDGSLEAAAPKAIVCLFFRGCAWQRHSLKDYTLIFIFILPRSLSYAISQNNKN
jgi:hypothetical protein